MVRYQTWQNQFRKGQQGFAAEELSCYLFIFDAQLVLASVLIFVHSSDPNY